MRFAFALIAVWLLAAPARAEVAAAAPGAFLVEAEAVVASAPDRAWRNLLRIERWWGSAHTYSGDAANLRLEPRAGGCWCERWDGQSVEHMRVVLVQEHEGVRTLRLIGGLGPLQEMGVSGVMTLTVAPDAAGAKLALSYRVSGEPGLGLDHIAPLVDAVLMEQFGHLVRYNAEAGGR